MTIWQTRKRRRRLELDIPSEVKGATRHVKLNVHGTAPEQHAKAGRTKVGMAGVQLIDKPMGG